MLIQWINNGSRGQDTPPELPVGWLNSFRNPSPPRWSPTISVTFQNGQSDIYTVISQLCGGERGARAGTILSSRLSARCFVVFSEKALINSLCSTFPAQQQTDKVSD